MRTMLAETLDQKCLEVANLCLSFGTVERQTLHVDGKTPESDSTHTVMLSVVACMLADEYYPDLDLGLICQLALVHDLHEALIGDTPTLRITDDQLTAKQEREKNSIGLLLAKFSSSEWLRTSLILYHNQIIPEARFLRAVDKNLPKLTHLLNDCAVLKQMGMTKEEFTERIIVRQSVELAGYAGDFPEVLEMHSRLATKIVEKL